MRVVIAGGSGLIGRALCAELLHTGHQPVVLSRHPRRRGLPAGAREAAWRPDTLEGWVTELDGADAVVNLAGASVGRWPWTAGRKRLLRESRLVPTRTIVSAIGSIPPGRRPRILVNASGSDLYEGIDAEPATEATPPADTVLARLCVDWEAEARAAEALGVRVVLSRTAIVLSPEAPALRLIALPFRLFVGGPVGGGRQWYSWVSLDDAARLLAWAIEREDVAGPLNVAAPDPRPQAEFARALGAALHRPSWLPTPAWPIRLVLGDQATLALGSRRVWPARAEVMGYRFVRPHLEDALAQLRS